LIASIGNVNTRRRWRGWSETADDSAAQQAFLIDTEIGEASNWIVARLLRRNRLNQNASAAILVHSVLPVSD